MQDFEKLGVFYLGRSYDLQSKRSKEGLLLYDSKDLVTHALCVGMTGSGKTGLCLGLLEEAAIDGIPAIIIDPKGDLANLLLTFPQLRPEDFAPWINEDEALRLGISSRDYAAQQAERWKKGLSEWGQSGERIQRLRDSAEFRIYTPGSTAGIPLSLLKSFDPPAPTVLKDAELLRDQISGTATSLLALLGIESDPVQSREHILLSNLLGHFWKQRQSLDLKTLIQQIQTPPFTQIGVLDLESFFPSKERFGLALRLNNLLAAPGFETWLEGEPFDVNSFLHSPGGKPRHSIFSIAHLADSERMFFVSMLLNQTLNWVRTQSGTSSLRALIYMDEIFGYFPPVANPPSKAPLLTLLKQARAFGVGIVLATQNPVDLDYKGLSNAGTWFIGRLQTERDKNRLLDGLEGAAVSSTKGFDRQEMEKILAGLGNRVFLMNNVHDEVPEVFETRWTLSYLGGPLTRNQIKTLMDAERLKVGETAPASPLPSEAVGAPGRVTPTDTVSARPQHGDVVSPVSSGAKTERSTTASNRPVLPPEVPQSFIPFRGQSSPAEEGLVYLPRILGFAKTYFSDTKTQVNVEQETVCLAEITDSAVPVNWEGAQDFELAVADLEKEPFAEAGYASLPPGASKVKNFEIWKRGLADALYRTRTLDLLLSPSLKSVSKPGESERDFRIRLQQAAREERDQLKERLRQQYAPKIAVLEERIRRARQIVERESVQAKQQTLQTAISFGATLLGAFMGRKAISMSTLGKATTAARGVGRSIKESQDVSRVQESVESLEQQMADLESQFQAELAALDTKIDPSTEILETLSLKPKKANISVALVTLAWTPHWQKKDGSLRPAY